MKMNLHNVKTTAGSVAKKFKLDSHHSIERFALFCCVVFVSGLLIIGTSGFAAFMSGRDSIKDTPLWNHDFTTSKTQLQGKVDGVYTNDSGNRALVMMHFDDTAKISYKAEDYEAYLLGSDKKMNSETLDTKGIKGSVHAFGSTGYIGVELESKEPFAQQVLNLTVRANAELSFTEQQARGESTEDVVGDKSFKKNDQWRIFVNPGARNVSKIDALDSEDFDPAKAFYEVALKSNEQQARKDLDTKLKQMQANQTQIQSYSKDLATTEVDGLRLKQPKVPKIIADDKVTGESAEENDDHKSTLDLETPQTVKGGFNFDWRDGNVYDGYLKSLVPEGQSYVSYIAEKTGSGSDTGSSSSSDSSSGVNDMKWELSDGTDLEKDYKSSDVTMRPLTTVMNNLSQAYQDYYTAKTEYQSDLLMDLLKLDVDLRDVEQNASDHDDSIVTYY